MKTIKTVTMTTAMLFTMFATSMSQAQSKPSGADVNTYKKTFLDATDLPGMRIAQDSRTRGADRNDQKFRELKGLRSGMTAWVNADQQKNGFVRIVDIRWVFPTAEAAQAYLRDQLPVMAEGMPTVKSAPNVGDESYVFGGEMADFLDAGKKIRSYVVVFRVGNVVVKFFQFDDSPDSGLTPRKMGPTCQKIVGRIKAVAK